MLGAGLVHGKVLRGVVAVESRFVSVYLVQMKRIGLVVRQQYIKLQTSRLVGLCPRDMGF